MEIGENEVTEQTVNSAIEEGCLKLSFPLTKVRFNYLYIVELSQDGTSGSELGSLREAYLIIMISIVAQ